MFRPAVLASAALLAACAGGVPPDGPALGGVAEGEPAGHHLPICEPGHVGPPPPYVDCITPRPTPGP